MLTPQPCHPPKQPATSLPFSPPDRWTQKPCTPPPPPHLWILESLLLCLVLRALDDLDPRDRVGAEVPEAVRVDVELKVPMASSNNCLICKKLEHKNHKTH